MNCEKSNSTLGGNWLLFVLVFLIFDFWLKLEIQKISSINKLPKGKNNFRNKTSWLFGSWKSIFESNDMKILEWLKIWLKKSVLPCYWRWAVVKWKRPIPWSDATDTKNMSVYWNILLGCCTCWQQLCRKLTFQLDMWMCELNWKRDNCSNGKFICFFYFESFLIFPFLLVFRYFYCILFTSNYYCCFPSCTIGCFFSLFVSKPHWTWPCALCI